MGAERSDSDAATGRFVDWLITTYNHYLGHWIKVRSHIRQDSPHHLSNFCQHNANTKMGIIEYSGMKTTAKVSVTLLSSMLPALSVFALYFESNMLNRIGIMIAMTFVFAATLTFGTSAKRSEIFAATAA